jgi:hypothetical protein
MFESKCLPLAFLLLSVLSSTLKAEEPRLTLKSLVVPTTSLYRDGQPVKFALYSFLEFQTLAELFAYIDAQAGRWQFSSAAEREAFADRLLQRGVESRLISMVNERPLELLLTHTAKELAQALAQVRTPAAPFIFQGQHWRLRPDNYADKFLQVQARWKTSLNCWSGSPSIAGRVLSNFYLIEEGISLFGTTYDSTEHFWQAVKYHPSVRLRELLALLDRMEGVNWAVWLAQLEGDQQLYLNHTYAIEFLRHNLTREQRAWFRREISQYAGHESARALQQRDPAKLRFTALQEKVLWGNLADLFHLLYYFAALESGRFRTAELKPLLEALVEFHFDGVYLPGYGKGKMDFISREFQRLMLEIWKVKFLRLSRFGEVIRSTRGIKLDHYLNDGDAPDIPLTVYIGFLKQIRELALKAGASHKSLP